MSDTARFLTVEQAGELVQLAPKTIRRLIESQEIPAIRIGESIRIPRRWLQHVEDAAMRERTASTDVNVEEGGAA